MGLFGLRGRWMVLVLLLMTAACSDPFQVIEEVVFDPSLGIDLATMTRLPSGVYIEDLVVGTGAELVPMATATVNYTGWLVDGTVFDSGPLSYPAVANAVVDGFLEGTLGMMVGGTRRMIIPPELGYGEAGRGSVPGGAIMIFEVELLEVS